MWSVEMLKDMSNASMVRLLCWEQQSATVQVCVSVSVRVGCDEHIVN